MKKNKILILIVLLLILTGCTKQLKDVNNKIVKNKKTGQTLPANILCRPTDKDIIKLYDNTRDEYIVKLDKKLKAKKISKTEKKLLKGLNADENKRLSLEEIKKSDFFKILIGKIWLC